MASGFFAVLDDIAFLMDDVVLASKIATKKTAGILGDDLAVNAEKATGFVSSRELPVLWAITKGSFINKLIIVPLVFLLNVIFPVAIKIALVVGGLYLAYEGVEKIIHWIFHRSEHEHEHTADGHIEDTQDAEKAKIKSAVKTDFILSVEIVIISFGSVLEKSLTTQIITVSVVALIATVGVYGIVALIVRMDDVGYSLLKKSDGKGILANIGNILVNLLPVIIRLLSIVGTIALILVAGGIFEHNIDFLHHLFPSIPTIIKEIVFGITGGLIVILAVTVIKKIIAQFKKTKKVEVPESAENEE
jgi:predicted DNA repair protein MutK